jgi:hypothetical protein
MNWIQKNYDRAALVAAAVLALIGSVWIIYKASGFNGQFAAQEVVHGRKFDAPDGAPVVEASRRLTASTQWVSPKVGEHKVIPLFSSTPFVVMNDKPTEPFPMLDPAAPKLRDPIENWWLVEKDLDYTAVDVREQDPDNDGYTNADEFQGNTDPNFSLSKPTWDTKLFYVQRLEEPLTLKLNSFDSGTCMIAFITKDAQGNDQRFTDPIQKGGSNKKGPEPGRFTVVDITTETVDRFGSPTQVAVAWVVDNKDQKKERIKLEQGKPVDHPTYIAKFEYTLTHEKPQAKVGGDFELIKPAGTTVTVEEIQADKVVISFVPEGKSEPAKVEKKLSPPPK